MRKIALLLTIVMFVLSQAVNAQTRTVTGTVTSAEDGTTLPGVSIVVKGTSIGTVSDIDGNFTINVPNDAETLVFSFVGMTTLEVLITGNTINVELESSSLNVDEVVVIGYGTTTKSSFTGTATEINAEKIESKNVSNISQALSGEVSGVQVINSNGQPGSTAQIRIRGIGSINGSREPLYIIDGVPLQGDINSIAPSDIESTTVLKDASATAIYGSRGANGVVIITSKKGKDGKNEIEVSLKQGVNFRMLPEYDVYNNPEEYVETAWSALKTRGTLSGQEDPAAYANSYLFYEDTRYPGFDNYYNMWNATGDKLIDPSTGKFNSGIDRKYTPDKWGDELFQGANRTEAGLKISGGNDLTTFYSSFNYLNDEGYYLNSDYERLTGRLNVDHKIRTWLKGSMNMNFMNSTSNFAGGQDEDSNNGFWFVANMPPIFPVYARDAEGNKIEDTIIGGNVFDYGDATYGTRRFASLTNAVGSSTYDVVRTTRKQFSGISKLEATFLKDFTLSSTFGVEYLNSAYDNLGNAFYGGSAEQGGSIYKVKNDYLNFAITNMLRYQKDIGRHHINTFVAQEAAKMEYKRMSAFKSGLVDPWSLELNNAVVSSPSGSFTEELMLVSYFGQLTYDFDEKYFFNGVLRRDGSSKFINEKWGTFGSVGLAWILSKESFMNSTSDFLDELKLKTSYGIIGEQGGIGSYDSYTLYSAGNQNDKIALTEDHVGNPDLTWEEANMFQVGLEFGLFDKISGAVDYYNKSTNNLLFDKRVAPSHGYAIMQINDGKMLNTGIEVELKAEIVKSNDFNINFSINGAFENNEITEMYIDEGTQKQKVIDISGLYGRSVDHSLFDIYTTEYVGVDTETGLAQWNRYYNEVNGTKEYITDMANYMAQNEGNIGTLGKETTTDYSEATEKYIDKSPIPFVRGSFYFDIDYKGFALTTLFNYSLGGYGYDANYASLMEDVNLGGNNWHKDIQNAWKAPGDVTDVPAITGGLNLGTGQNYNQSNRASDRFVTKTDYLALNNVSLSYTFTKSALNKLNIKGLKVFVSGDNLWVGSERKGFYPNTSEVGSSERYQYVSLTSITAGINVKF
ncbi:MAG: SusC/RagA family TonB-linked outer membrane protein [Prolixibacteraceae bacterium]|jgi:TonB-linked SusC/RagA family outer membrane protein|nr:SusC/RagA family TonB-linked outer membrane protein [Prolixibacteraceae bacterium]